jgi:hypothetical protein
LSFARAEIGERVMASVWPWLAIAGLGALHGLNPATGWIWAAAWGLRSHDRSRALRALLPIAGGHAGSIALVAAAVSFGLSMDRDVLVAVAAALLATMMLLHVSRRCDKISAPTGYAGLALWSFMMSTVHGAGLMLVPALVPLCVAGDAARQIGASGSLTLALAAIAVHSAAMVAVIAVMASGACRGVDALARLRRAFASSAPR